MPLRFPTPQSLIDQVLRALPHPPRPPAAATTEDRILDAALDCFTARGIRGATMSQIASDAGISREWLYKHFRNRDSVLLAVARREIVRFIDGLAVHTFAYDDVTDAVVDAFVYSVEYLRDHALVSRVLREPDSLSPRLLERAPSMVSLAVETGAGYFQALGEMERADATVVAETLVRLVAAITVAPQGKVDLHDPEMLRDYAGRIVPAVLVMGGGAAARPSSTSPGGRTSASRRQETGTGAGRSR